MDNCWFFPPKEFHPIWDTHMFQLWNFFNSDGIDSSESNIFRCFNWLQPETSHPGTVLGRTRDESEGINYPFIGERLQDLVVVFTLPETSSSPLKIGRNPKGNSSEPTPVFQVRTVSFREATSQKDGFLWTLDSRCELRVSKRINIDTAHFAIMSKKRHVIFATSYTVRAE